jgi:hypothetical protein
MSKYYKEQGDLSIRKLGIAQKKEREALFWTRVDLNFPNNSRSFLLGTVLALTPTKTT